MSNVYGGSPTLISITCLFFLLSCGKPLPDSDTILGRFMTNQSCQGNGVYLVAVDKIQAYKTGYTTYRDTLTLGSTRFDRVVQLDTTQLEPYIVRRLHTYQPGDKIAIFFTIHRRDILPSCLSRSPRDIETIVINEFGQAAY